MRPLKTKMLEYTRVMQVDIRFNADESSRAVARLDFGSPSLDRDFSYQMWADIERRDGVMTIAEAGVDVLTLEAGACDSTRELVPKLSGIRLDRTYLWRISNVLGRSNGCQHLYELALEIGRAYANLSIGEYMNGADTGNSAPSKAPVDFARHCAGLSSIAGAEDLAAEVNP